MKTIEINNLGCNFTITVPIGWDTIPHNALVAKVGPSPNTAIALYNKSQDYFSSYYVYISFQSTKTSLSTLSFEDIFSEVDKSIENSPRNIGDSLTISNVRTTSNIHNQSYHILTEMLMENDTSKVESLQDLYLTKYGFININCYKKHGCDVELAEIDSIISTNIIISDEYAYAPPVSNRSIHWSDMFISLAIGAIAYFLIWIYERRKFRITK